MKRMYVVFAVLIMALLQVNAAEKAEKTATYTGTAFVIHPDGYLLTANHVVFDANKVSVALGGKTYEASVLDADYDTDIALLHIDATGLPALTLRNSNDAQIGEELRAFGYPLADTVGTSIKATRGTLSGFTNIHAKRTFQVDAPINPGNSGGPIVDEKGAVVGVVDAKLSEEGVEGIGFAVPINYARSLLRYNFITPTDVSATDAKFTGPDLVKHVSPAVALVTAVCPDYGDEDKDGTYIPEVVKAKCFVVADKNGKTRVKLQVTDDGDAGMAIFDPAGNGRADIDVRFAWMLVNPDSVPRVALILVPTVSASG
ncbi:MAG TPA: S1C family serine protease [Armatimonadota bacterium]|nr:S1C family serine protease [Armatimonadota bacterium]